MPQILPITDLRKTNEISELCHKERAPIFITKNGYGDMVIMSMEAYEMMLRDSSIDGAISEAEHEMEAAGSEFVNARDAFSALRRKYVDKV